ncbi:MAG: PIG-L family deacetylase [bacterium]|nr:PIG-L family deacetylase [bacterium]
MRQSVLAIAAHPDDIEFVMAGTLLRLIDRGWTAHYFNLANGCCGSMQLSREQCAAVRLQEARRVAEALPAEFYPPICDDLQIFYNAETHAQVAAVVRRARPQIILTHAPADYMEDHQNAARLAVGGAFVRGMPNFESLPPEDAYGDDVAVYHAQPHGNRDPLGTLVIPTHFVDVTDLIPRKRELLSYHESQAGWLDATQSMGSYLNAMVDLNAEVGQLSGKFRFCEGWRQHIHLGLSAPAFDPLQEALGETCLRSTMA